MSDSDWYDSRIECAERGRRALCALHGLLYPNEIDYCYTRPDEPDTDYVACAEDITPFRTEDFAHNPEGIAWDNLVDDQDDDWHGNRFPPHHIAAPDTWYERQDWIAHYDAMQPSFAQLTERGPDPWRSHRNKHGNQPWWEPRWETLAIGQMQWDGCDEGLCERVSARCRSCYNMQGDTTADKIYTWCKHCPCECESLETCYEFPDHGQSRATHCHAMQHVFPYILHTHTHTHTHKFQ